MYSKGEKTPLPTSLLGVQIKVQGATTHISHKDYYQNQ